MTSNKIARLFGAATVFAAAAGVSTAQADTVAAWQGICSGGGASTSCSALISPANTAPNIAPNAGATFTTQIINSTTFTPSGGSGVYNFFTASTNSIAGFLGTSLATAIGAAGNYANGATSSTPVTSASAGNTEWRFTFSVSSPQLLSVTHDDGVALFGASGVIKPDNETTNAAAIPQAVDGATLYTLLAGNYTLYYVSSNDLPEVLQTTLTPTIPLPATLPLFATGLAGLGLLGWRRKKKAIAA